MIIAEKFFISAAPSRQTDFARRSCPRARTRPIQISPRARNSTFSPSTPFQCSKFRGPHDATNCVGLVNCAGVRAPFTILRRSSFHISRGSTPLPLSLPRKGSSDPAMRKVCHFILSMGQLCILCSALYLFLDSVSIPILEPQER